VSGDLIVRLDRLEALELLAVDTMLGVIARTGELTVGAAILVGIRSKLIVALEGP
jgi:hypothetical protein